MAVTVLLKKSSTPGSAPTTGQISLGELAVNTYDGKLYAKKSVSAVETVLKWTPDSAKEITGGTINGASVGATTPSTGAFTTLSASSTATAPTASPGTNTTAIATTAFVTAAVAAGNTGAITNVIAAPLTIAVDTSFTALSYLKISSTLTVNGNLGVAG